MIDDVNIKRRQMNKAYRDLFGYIPLPSDYACTSKEFFESVEKAVTEKKEISNYLKKRAKHINGTLD